MSWDRFQHVLGNVTLIDAPVGTYGRNGDLEKQLAFLAEDNNLHLNDVDKELLAFAHFIDRHAPAWARRDLRSRFAALSLSKGDQHGGRGGSNVWCAVLAAFDNMLCAGPVGIAEPPKTGEEK